MIVATGSGYRKLGLPNEDALSGRGVSWCATCDGFFFRDRDIVVVGGGDTAMEEATFLTRFARSVTVVHRRSTLRASKVMQNRAFADDKISFAFDSEIAEIHEEDGMLCRPHAARHVQPARPASSRPPACSSPSATTRAPNCSRASWIWTTRATSRSTRPRPVRTSPASSPPETSSTTPTARPSPPPAPAARRPRRRALPRRPGARRQARRTGVWLRSPPDSHLRRGGATHGPQERDGRLASRRTSWAARSRSWSTSGHAWCGPCRQLAPSLEAIAADHGDTIEIVKLNIDENPATALKYGVMSIPTMNLYVGGEVTKSIIGAKPKAAVERELDGIIG